MRKSVAVVSAMVAVIMVGTLTSPAQAAGVIQFRKFYYNSPGSDTGSNYSLNAEYFTLKNTGSSTRDISGWKVRDKAGYTYVFPAGSKVAAGNSVKVHTGKGTDTSYHRYWNRSWYVWNNTGDAGTVRNRSGTLSDSCSWSSNGSGYKNC